MPFSCFIPILKTFQNCFGSFLLKTCTQACIQIPAMFLFFFGQSNASLGLYSDERTQHSTIGSRFSAVHLLSFLLPYHPDQTTGKLVLLFLLFCVTPLFFRQRIPESLATSVNALTNLSAPSFNGTKLSHNLDILSCQPSSLRCL